MENFILQTREMDVCIYIYKRKIKIKDNHKGENVYIN